MNERPVPEHLEPPISHGTELSTARRPFSRRHFLGVAGGAAATAAGGAALWSALMREHLEDAVSSGSDQEPDPAGSTLAPASDSASSGGRTLVVLQLGGGNDGLNTLVPGNDGRYYDARPTLGVPQGEIVALNGVPYGLHPELAPLVPLWDDGRLVAVDAVGFLQGQSRSHFQAMDLWWSAQPGQARTTGWLGRWLDHGDVTNPLRAISLGTGSPALMGAKALSTAVRDPGAFRLLAPQGADAAQLGKAFAATAQPLAQDPDLAAAQQSIPSALRAVDLLQRVTGSKGESASKSTTRGTRTGNGATAGTDGGLDRTAKQNKGNRAGLTELLEVAAGIIDLQIGTEIIVVGISGFDTHANQATAHPQLLGDLGEGLRAFLAAIDAQGRRDDVLVMTTSEFGRRVQETGNGTDHGEGGVQFLAGKAVNGHQVIGSADLGKLDNGDVRSSIDTRSLYANALDWLSGDPNRSDEILSGRFDRLGMLAG